MINKGSQSLRIPIVRTYPHQMWIAFMPMFGALHLIKGFPCLVAQSVVLLCWRLPRLANFSRRFASLFCNHGFIHLGLLRPWLIATRRVWTTRQVCLTHQRLTHLSLNGPARLRCLANPSPWRLRTVRAGRPPSAYAVHRIFPNVNTHQINKKELIDPDLLSAR